MDKTTSTILCVAAGVAVAGAAMCCFVHRRVIAAAIKGEPLPVPPKWHQHCMHR